MTDSDSTFARTRSWSLTLDGRGSAARACIPDSIGRLNKLRTLKLGANSITELPETIGQLEKLQNPAVGFNQLVELPETVADLASLETLADPVLADQLPGPDPVVGEQVDKPRPGSGGLNWVLLDLYGNPVVENGPGIAP